MADRESGEPTPFGKYLSDAMKAQTPKMERADLADRVGVDASTISRWIMKPGKPQTEKLHALADALGLDHGEVLFRAGHGRPAENVAPYEPETQPLTQELDRMLSAGSPLTDLEREKLALIIDAAIEPYRSRMRRTRRAS